jgi:hypothetical protein
MKYIGGFKGATGYEAWLWRISIHIPYWSFILVGCKPRISFDRSDQ